MTVAQVIERLNEIKDKSRTVYVYSFDMETMPSEVIEEDDGVLII